METFILKGKFLITLMTCSGHALKMNGLKVGEKPQGLGNEKVLSEYKLKIRKKKWIRPDYYVSQFDTGHRDFRAKLYGFGLSETETCDCGEQETLKLILKECILYSSLKREETCLTNVKEEE